MLQSVRFVRNGDILVSVYPGNLIAFGDNKSASAIDSLLHCQPTAFVKCGKNSGQIAAFDQKLRAGKTVSCTLDVSVMVGNETDKSL
jgi:hypothetical protein